MRAAISPAGAKRLPESGQALVEFVFMTVMLLVMVFGLIDFGRAIYNRQILINLTREAANLSSRGTSLADTEAAILLSAQPLDLLADGTIILTVVERDDEGALTIVEQSRSAGGLNHASRVGSGVGSSATLPSTAVEVPARGDKLYVAEIYHRFGPVTPVGKLIQTTLPDTLSDIAYF